MVVTPQPIPSLKIRIICTKTQGAFGGTSMYYNPFTESQNF